MIIPKTKNTGLGGARGALSPQKREPAGPCGQRRVHRALCLCRAVGPILFGRSRLGPSPIFPINLDVRESDAMLVQLAAAVKRFFALRAVLLRFGAEPVAVAGTDAGGRAFAVVLARPCSSAGRYLNHRNKCRG